MTTFQIEKNIPLPADLPGGFKTKYPFSEMKVGDSFEIGEYSANRMRSMYGSITYFLKRVENKKKKFQLRKTDSNTIRVWRIK